MKGGTFPYNILCSFLTSPHPSLSLLTWELVHFDFLHCNIVVVIGKCEEWEDEEVW